jgi:hypothetical protein
MVLAGNDTVNLELALATTSRPVSATFLLDDKPVASEIAAPSQPAADTLVRAHSGGLAPGLHSARVTLSSENGGRAELTWTFWAASPGEGAAYFKETGFFVTGAFLNYWNGRGGLALFGYPISDRIVETDAATGEKYLAQYFERARFEQHGATAELVVLGRLGALVRPAEPPAAPLAGSKFFAETGHNLSGAFLAFWEKRGGLDLFGYPITEALSETDAASGKTYTVQYFERNRFELHPEFAGTQNEVLLGQLGRQVLDARQK